MTLSDLSIKKPVFAWMLMAALLIFGGFLFYAWAFHKTPTSIFQT
jgi:multidrug efflux pump subunit AcrB